MKNQKEIKLPQREIKFRVWDKKRRKMYYLGEDMPYLEIYKNDWFWEWGCADDKQDLNKKNGILMQYTGLKDKRGKEIYEGDILRIDRDCETGKLVNESNEKVYWRNGEFIVHRTRYPKDWEDYEVIGNIFENPELLANLNI